LWRWPRLAPKNVIFPIAKFFSNALLGLMGNAMRSRNPKPYANIFHEMDAVHIQAVFDELADRFGFPEKKWKVAWRAYIDSKPRGEDEIGLFLGWGYEKINPLLNGLLMRSSSESTFANLCEYIIKRSSTYQNKQKEMADRVKFYKKVS
jgi:hypothetical protein